jgi:DNA-binding GntR family transcriptional regulator
MKDQKGWIALQRTITNHWIWDSEPYSKGQAWVDLLLHANHTDAKITIKGSLINLERGQQARSQVTLSEQWKWSRDKVKRFLKLLENDGMIRQQTSQLTSIITICNYKDYQLNKAADKSADDTAGRHQTSQQAAIRQVTVNNGNNGNNGNNEEEGENVGKKPRAQFEKPSLIDIENHMLTKGLDFEQAKDQSERFYNYYESNGWKVGKNKMVNWKSSASGWLSRNNDFKKPTLDINSTGWEHG